MYSNAFLLKKDGFIRLMLATSLGVMFSILLWALVSNSRLTLSSRMAQAAPDLAIKKYHTPRLSASHIVTRMRPAEKALWAAVGGLEAAYLMNPNPYDKSLPQETPELAEWVKAALAEEASTAAPEHESPEKEIGQTDTLTYSTYLPMVAREWTAPEARALWVTRYDFCDPAGDCNPTKIQTIMTQAASAHFNIILFQVRANGDAYYRSNYEPWSARISGTLGQDPGWDPLAVAITAAHQAGLELHAYLNIYPAWIGETSPITGTTPLHIYHTLTQTYGSDWLHWDENGAMQLNTHYLWASPGHPAVASHIISVCRDIVENYEVDGLHLDNVRYAGSQYSQDPTSLSRYTPVSGTITYSDWQRLQVTELVSRIYTDILTNNLKLSAAVWPYYDSGYGNYYQDSLGWLRAGAMDAIAPMLYAGAVLTDNAAYEERIIEFVSGSNNRQVWAGITGEYDSFDAIADRIQIARWNGAAGQAIFRYALIDAKNYWDDFLNGPYSVPVNVPEMSWK